jgi:ribosomal-protein-alanine N-acetyltransferase
MQFQIETERLILRDILPIDDLGMFELDSNPEVLRYLGTPPITSINQAREAIGRIRQQYIDYSIGRWATIEKESGNFIGWSGLKFMTDAKNNQHHFYDVGYRFIPKYWGKGYATESTKAALKYAFTIMNLQEVIGTCHEENVASRKALEKCGLKFIEQYNHEDKFMCDWLRITKEEWEKNVSRQKVDPKQP